MGSRGGDKGRERACVVEGTKWCAGTPHELVMLVEGVARNTLGEGIRHIPSAVTFERKLTESHTFVNVRGGSEI